MSWNKIRAAAKVSPRARYLYLLAGEVVRDWLNENTYGALEKVHTLERPAEIAFVSAMVAHSFMAMGEEGELGDFCAEIARLDELDGDY